MYIIKSFLGDLRPYKQVERVPAKLAYFLIKNKVFTFNIIAHKKPIINLQ